MIDNDIKGNEMENEFTTDVLGIISRNYEDTLVTRNQIIMGIIMSFCEYVENGTFTITHYQYHNPMDIEA